MNAMLPFAPCARGRSADRRRALSSLALLALLPACRDDLPTAPIPAGPPVQEVRLECRASVAEGRVICDEGTPPAGGAPANLTLGSGRVELESRNARYDGVGVFSVEVRVHNLIDQVLGTVDSTVAPQGIRVFFSRGPTATAGAGEVEVANPSGRAMFTDAEQPYFQYDTLLQPDQWSAWKEWRFSCPPTVAAFAFAVYVRAPVPPVSGWIEVPEIPVRLLPGKSLLVPALAWEGQTTVSGVKLAWTSSDTTIAIVSQDGTVTGVGPGMATITASTVFPSVHRHPGSNTVVVAAFDAQGPHLDSLAITPAQPDIARMPDPWVAVDLTILEMSGVRSATVTARAPNGDPHTCETTAAGGAGSVRVRRCVLPLRSYPPLLGPWRLEITMTDSLGNGTTMDADALRQAGHPHAVTLVSSNDPPPQLVSLDVSPDTLFAGWSGAELNVRVNARDDGGTAIRGGYVNLRPPSGQSRYLSCSFVQQGPNEWGCRVEIHQHAEQGTWTVDNLVLRDAINTVTLSGTELAAAGHDVEALVLSDTADHDPPVVTYFSLSDHGDFQVIELGLMDVSGAFYTFEVFISHYEERWGTFYDMCIVDRVAGTPQYGTYTCTIPITTLRSGRWQIAEFWVADELGNAGPVTGQDLEREGWNIYFNVP